jgi:hypothetical protein
MKELQKQDTIEEVFAWLLWLWFTEGREREREPV